MNTARTASFSTTMSRSVVSLTFYAESSAAAVGADLGVSEGNVRVIRHRAIERLRTCMMSRDGVQ